VNEAVVLALAKESLIVALEISAPILGASLVIGIVVSIIQAVTQVNEMTLTFVPKLIGIFVAMLIFGPWMMQTLLGYSAGLFTNMAAFGR
jgi:flagellar biosynthetic protein FliQ